MDTEYEQSKIERAKRTLDDPLVSRRSKAGVPELSPSGIRVKETWEEVIDTPPPKNITAVSILRDSPEGILPNVSFPNFTLSFVEDASTVPSGNVKVRFAYSNGNAFLFSTVKR